MNPPQPNPANMATDAARWWAKASGARTRTHVPRIPTEGTVMSHDTSEVTAQRMTAAFNAVQNAAAYLLGNRDLLELTPIGRQWLEDAEAMQRLADEPGA